MSKMSCNIIKDLIPSYVDDLCSEESRKSVQEHVEECPECKAVLESMLEGWKVEADENGSELSALSVEQQKIIKEVNDKLKKDIRKKTTKYIAFCCILVAAMIFFLTPIKKISAEDVDIRYFTYSVSDIVSDHFFNFAQCEKDAVIYVEDDEDIGVVDLYELKIPENHEYNVYASTKWLDAHEDISVVYLYSSYPIKKYSYLLKDENGDCVFSLENAKTNFLSKKGEGTYSVKILLNEEINQSEK